MGALHYVMVILSFDYALSIPIDNGLILKPRAQPGGVEFETVCGAATSDLFFIIDGSSSIKAENFKLLQKFLADFASGLPDGVRVGAVQFSGGVRTEFSFNTYGPETNKIADHFRTMPWIQGITNLGKAITYSLEKELIEKSGDREDANDIVIVITDGQADDDPKGPAAELRKRAEVLVVGVTDFIDKEQLDDVAGSADKVFTVESFESLDDDLQKDLLSKTSCRQVSKAPEFGDPSLDINCGTDSIVIGSDTQNDFEGTAYVKGHHDDPECFQKGDGSRFAQITVPFDNCGTNRRRSLNPPGVFVENTVVFRFHPTFLTKIDRAFKVQCFYMEADKTVSQELSVDMLTTSLITQQFPMPVCTYTIHQDSPTGPPVKFAIIGQPVFHKWNCDDTQSQNLFKMKVKNCFVEDGQGTRANIIDEFGCTLDKHLLPNLQYSDSVMMAVSEAHVFKFADRPALFFQCQIELCVDAEDGCIETPPVCSDPERRKRQTLIKNPFSDDLEMTLDVISDRMSIVDQSDIDLEWYRNSTRIYNVEQRESVKTEKHDSVCLTDMEMYFFLSLTCGSFLLVSSIAVAQIIFKRSL